MDRPPMSSRTCAAVRPWLFSAAIASSTPPGWGRSEEHTSELQSQSNLVCRLLLEKKNNHHHNVTRCLSWARGCRTHNINRLDPANGVTPYYHGHLMRHSHSTFGSAYPISVFERW